MNPVIIGNATLYLGDCLEILPTLEKVDVVITDPPYSSNTHKNAQTNKFKEGPTDRVRGGKLVRFESLSSGAFCDFCDECLLISKRWVVMTCDHRHAPFMFDRDEFIRLGAWVKTNPVPQITGDRPGQGHEAVLILHNKGKKQWNGGGSAAIWRMNKQNEAGYPTQKPQQLTDSFVSLFSNSSELILDPCMGSGTTGVSALNQGRSFIGIEIKQEPFDIACERIEQAQKQGRLFA